MTDIANKLLLQLKNYTECNDDLALMVRKTVLEPFQLDLSRPDSIKKPPPTPQRFKQMATQLAPVAMRIVNQNLEALAGLKRAISNNENYIIAVNCLVDTSFYALTALRHMNSFTTLKPLDIEKTTSNLICKMVELGEYTRALDEIRKFRSLLGSVAKVPLDTKSTVNIKTKTGVTISKSVLTETQENQQSKNKRSFSPVPESLITTQWEEEMLRKYQDLFQFPLDTTINDRTMVLLVLAYQMNTLRCWCEIGDGALAKFIPYFMEKSGNFIDWCQQLESIDSVTAKKQLDSFQRLVYKTANKYPLTEDSAFHCYNLQTVALNIMKLSGLSPLKSVMDRMVRIGMTYEKATSQTSYEQLLQRCQKFLENLNPNVNNIVEMDSYFLVCEYYAYVSGKAKSYQGEFYAYKYMILPLRDVIQNPSSCTYYYAAYAANAKLALTSVQMEKMINDDIFMDINKSFNEINSCLQIVATTLESEPTQDDSTEQALYNLCKSIDGFRRTAKSLYEFVSEKTKKALMASKNDPFKTPPRAEELATPSDFGQWNGNMAQLNVVLQKCSEILPASLCLTKKKTNSTNKRKATQSDIMISFIDIMVLLARMNFNIADEDTHHEAYEYLSSAEQMCGQVKFSEGYRWLSGSYYNLGATMIKTELYSSAIYPLRKSCSLLEKDVERMNTDEGKLQISKRYEILGTCCQKNERFEDAIKAYRFALKRVPISSIEKFTSRADTTAISTIIEMDPVVPKLIDRFLRASIIDPYQTDIHFASEFMDLTTLTPVQQCAIYECELKVWNFLSLKLNVTKFQKNIIEKLLEVYQIEEYPIRRARILLNQVRLERSSYSDKQNSTREALRYAKEAIQCLNVQSYGDDSNLLNYRRYYLALAYSWVAICGRELNEEVPNTFSSTLQQWGILLKRITPIYHSGGSSKADIEHVYHSIDDIEYFYDHLRMLADLFGVTGQYIYQISALRLLLKLNNGLRDTNADSVSDSITITSTIASIYCHLGYTGKAETEFTYARNAISSRPCSNTAEIVYRINYAYYLTLIGDYEKSKEFFDATKMTWQHISHVDSKNEYVTAKKYTAQCMLLADAYTTKSYILANTSTLDQAIGCSMAALRLLNKCVAVVQKANAERSEKRKAVSTELENPFMPAPKTDRQEEAKKMVFRESQWVMAQKMASCFVRIALLYMKKGSWNEVGYFLKQGPLLAEKVNSNMIFFNACLCASEFNLRFGNLNESKDNLEEAVRYQPEGENHLLDQVQLKLAMGTLAISKEYFNEAISTFDEVNVMLQQLSQSDYISSIEQLVDIKEDGVRDSKVMFDDEMDKSNAKDCIPLNQLLVESMIHKAIALSHVGKVPKALVLLEKLKETEIMNDNEVELEARIVDIKLSMLRQETYNRNDTKVLLQESMILPVMKVKAERGRMGSSTVMNHEVRLIRDSLASSMERIINAIHAGYSRERPTVIQSLCGQAIFSLFLQNQISSSTMMVNNSSLQSTYYMEMAKGLSMRRDMQNCLQIKMHKVLPGQSPSDKDWPLTEEEQLQQADRFSHMNSNPEWLQSHLNTLSNLYREEDDLDEGEFQEKFVDILPSNWTVCSLALDPVNQDLYAVRMRTKETPFVVKIPLTRAFHRSNATKVISYEEAVNELKEIIEGSDETIRNSQNCSEPAQVEAWWQTRKDLDTRLKKLLDLIENQWFSGFKGILSGRYYESKDQLNRFQKGMNELVFRIMSSFSPVKKPVELSMSFCRMALCLGRRPNFQDVEDLCYFILSNYQAQGIQINYEKLDIGTMKDQMKALIARYHEKSNVSGIDTIKHIPNDHVILILDKHLQMFPFESTPILQQQSVSRLPCLSFLRDRILYARSYGSRDVYDDFGLVEWKDISVSRKNAFYVLNPSGDLMDTQKEFEPLFRGVPEWDGVSQTMPMELQCKEALLSRDVYMYFGHSAGQSFMRGTTVRQLPKCSVSLLMGCSSGMLESNGEFEPYGYVLNYLLAGSPAVVANLWDVTDRSIDKLTKHMLYTWGMLKKNNTATKSKSLVQAVTESRSQGKLAYLIGAATVVYGIPVYVDQ